MLYYNRKLILKYNITVYKCAVIVELYISTVYQIIFNFYVIDLNLIPIILNNSKENILNAAKHCYLRALELEKNINNTNNLSKQIGIVYIEYIKMYTVEIISKL